MKQQKSILQPLFTTCVADANFAECPICKEKITWKKDVVVVSHVNQSWKHPNILKTPITIKTNAFKFPNHRI